MKGKLLILPSLAVLCMVPLALAQIPDSLPRVPSRPAKATAEPPAATKQAPAGAPAAAASSPAPTLPAVPADPPRAVPAVGKKGPKYFAPQAAAAPAPPAAAEQGPPASAQELMRQATRAIGQHQSITAKLRQEIRLYSQELLAVGAYYQGPAATRSWRWELQSQTEDRPSVFQQISDGRQLWIYRRAYGTQLLERVDLLRVADVMHGPSGAWTAMGGLPKLLAALERSFEFRDAHAAQWHGHAVWALEGGWNPSMLAQMLPAQKEAIDSGKKANLKSVGEHVPDNVVIYLGRQSLFPHAIEYSRTRSAPRTSRWAQPKGESLVILRLEFFDVEFNQPIDPGQFKYQPGNLQAEDGTGGYIARLEKGLLTTP